MTFQTPKFRQKNVNFSLKDDIINLCAILTYTGSLTYTIATGIILKRIKDRNFVPQYANQR